MPLYRAEITSIEPDITSVASYWADDEGVARARAIQEYAVQEDDVTLFAVDPEECRALMALEKSLGGQLFSIRAEWESGRLVGLDLGEAHCCWGDVRDKHLKMLPRFKSLKSLSLRGNLRITDKGLTVLAELPSLTELILDEMQIGDGCLLHLTNMTELSTLYLGKATLHHGKIKRKGKVTDSGMRCLSGLTRLSAVSLSYTNVTGESFAAFRGFSELEHLFLEATPFNDDGMKHIARMPRLKQLQLQETQVTDAGLVHLAGLQELEILYLNGSKVTDHGIAKLAGLKSLKQLYFDGRCDS
jgi:hypothetical protein